MNLLYDHFEELTRRPELADKLKALILQLAVQGKLVPQDPNDEPASELLKRIQAEKQRMIELGIEKRRRSLPPIGNSETPFKLPNQWIWTRLGDITNYGFSDKREPSQISSATWILELEDVEKGTSKLLKKVMYPERISKSTKNVFHRDDVIYGKLRPYLDKVIVADEGGVCTTEMLPIRGYTDLSPFYIRLYLKSPYFVEYATNSTHGMNLPRLGTDKGRLAVFPLPPLNEQKRIVAKVESLLKKVDAIVASAEKTAQTRIHLGKAALNQLSNGVSKTEFRQGWQRIEQHFGDLFSDLTNVKALRQSILQLAVQGKLVPQDPTDEPASELLKRIRAEKQRLIAAGEIKKEKPLPPIAEDEIPFELPAGWEWCRVGDLTKKLGAGSTPLGGKSVYIEKGIKFLRSQNVWNDGLKLEGVAHIPEKIHEKKNGTHVQAKDILLNITGASIGRCALVPDNFDSANVSQHVAIVRMVETNIREFIHIFLISPFVQDLIMNVQVGISREGLSMSRLKEFVLPLPPLNEQKRIVAKAESLMQLCDRLEQHITHSDETAARLMDAILKQPVGQ